MTLEYLRDGQPATATATLGERRRCGFDVSGLIDLEDLPRIELENLPQVIDLDDLPDWERQLERLQEVDVDGIEERLRAAMQRLRELEEEIRSTREELEDDDRQP